MQEQNKFSIRPAALKDVEQIFDLIRQHKDDLITRSVGDITQNIDRFVVCDSEGRVVGCAAWKILPEIGEPESASVEIQSVAVSEGFRHNNIGSLIVSNILERVKLFEPAQAIVLTFAPEFFRVLGFMEIPKTKVMHKIYMGCINCTKHTNPFTCPEIAMSMDLREKQSLGEQ